MVPAAQRPHSITEVRWVPWALSECAKPAKEGIRVKKCKRERERETGRGAERDRERKRQRHVQRERDRGREEMKKVGIFERGNLRD